MTGLLAAEYLKLRKRVFFWVLAGLVWGLYAFAAWLSFTLDIGTQTGGSGARVNFPELIALVLAIQVLGSEFSGGRWAAGLTRDSRRGAHLLAKAVAGILALGFLVVTAVAVGQVMAAALGEEAAAVGSLVEAVAKGLLVGSVWIMIGFAFTAVLRGVGPAYMVSFVFFFADGLVSIWDTYRPLSVSHNMTLFYQDEGGVPVLLLWSVAAAAVAWLFLRYRDA